MLGEEIETKKAKYVDEPQKEVIFGKIYIIANTSKIL